jgi:hypothetical protein
LRRKAFIAALALIAVVQLSYAGDVVYTMWEDDGGQLWVRIQNDTNRPIKVESILIVSYNKSGKPVNQKDVPCEGNCRLSPHDTRDFGPYDPPANSESSRVRNVKYTVE